MKHAFGIGAQVRVVLQNYPDGSYKDTYEVVKQLPQDDTKVFMYRVKRLHDGRMRAVTEGQMTSSASGPGWGPPR